MFRSITKRQWTLIFLGIIVILAAIFILPISIPLVLALITALILNPLIRLTQRKTKINRKLSVIIVFTLFLMVVAFIGATVISKAVTEVVNLVEDVPAYVNQMNQIYQTWEEELQGFTDDLPAEFVDEVTKGIESNLHTLSETVREKITLDNIAQIFAKIPEYLISILVYLIALFLFMLELPILKTKMYQLFTKETAEKVSFMNARLASVFFGFFKAQFLVSMIIFAVTLIGLFIIIPEVAIIMSLIIWAVDLIPIIGSIIVLGPWAAYALLAGDTVFGIQLAVLAIVLLAIRRTVEPKVMGEQIGLSPLATLISMFLGLQLLGIWGFILGPLLVIVFTSAKEVGIFKWNIKL
ncbi:sporulation integral membrane protein YtvI [Virgibacillus kimchii]